MNRKTRLGTTLTFGPDQCFCKNLTEAVSRKDESPLKGTNIYLNIGCYEENTQAKFLS